MIPNRINRMTLKKKKKNILSQHIMYGYYKLLCSVSIDIKSYNFNTKLFLVYVTHYC